MSYSSIIAVLLRHAHLWKRDMNLLLGAFYWPLLDLLLWGFLGMWIQQATGDNFQHFTVTALFGMLLWQVIGRGTNVINIALNEELWTKNLATLFSMPLSIGSWMTGVILFYTIMMLATSFFCISCIALLYGISWWFLMSTFFLFLPPLFVAALWVGFSCLALIALIGKRGTELAFVVGWFLLPFSGAYYPVTVLPAWAQKISWALPVTPVFESMRGFLMHGHDPLPGISQGFLMGIPYALLAMILFVCCFNYSKRRGLARLAD